MRPHRYSTILSCAVLALLAGPAASQTLFLAQQEVDISDPAAMDAVIDRCASLAAASPDGRSAAAFTRKQPAGQAPAAEAAAGADQPAAQEPDAQTASGEDQSVVEDPGTETASDENQPAALETASSVAQPAVDPAALSLEADDAATSGEASASAGEGDGEVEATGDGGAQATLAPGGSEDASEGIDLEAVTLEACKAAGLVY